jgi:hypothetical protein
MIVTCLNHFLPTVVKRQELDVRKLSPPDCPLLNEVICSSINKALIPFAENIVTAKHIHREFDLRRIFVIEIVIKDEPPPGLRI